MPKHPNDRVVPTQRPEKVAAKEQVNQMNLDDLKSVADIRAALAVVLRALGLRD